MSNIVIVSLLNVVLVLQSCDTIPVIKKESGTTVPNQNAAQEECDFSEFSPVRIQHFDSDAVLKREQPEFPKNAVRRGIEGRVVVKALINAEGKVEKACATQGESELRVPAERAVLRWEFKPGYGLAFSRPNTSKNPKNYAEVFVAFDFKP